RGHGRTQEGRRDRALHHRRQAAARGRRHARAEGVGRGSSARRLLPSACVPAAFCHCRARPEFGIIRPAFVHWRGADPAMPKLSPLAPAESPVPGPLVGVRLAATACGIRYSGRTDLCLIELAPGTTAAGVLTRSLTASAPVDWCRTCLKRGRARAIVINSANSNAFTGKLGRAAVRETVEAAARVTGAPRHEIFVASTGVIGEPLPAGKIVSALPRLRDRLRDDGWSAAAQATMTTDTF